MASTDSSRRPSSRSAIRSACGARMRDSTSTVLADEHLQAPRGAVEESPSGTGCIRL